MTLETEWRATCREGHTTYERVRGVLSEDVKFSDCPRCGSPRRGFELPPLPSGDYWQEKVAELESTAETWRELVRELVEGAYYVSHWPSGKVQVNLTEEGGKAFTRMRTPVSVLEIEEQEARHSREISELRARAEEDV